MHAIKNTRKRINEELRIRVLGLGLERGKDMFDFSGKVVCVVGGAGHLGSAICRGFLEQNASLIIGDCDENQLHAVVSKLRDEFPEGSVEEVFVNIKKTSMIDDMVGYIKEKYTYLNVLVNATFSASGRAFDELTESDFNRVNEINITASFSLIKRCLPIIRDGGSIIQFSSMYGLISPNPADYPNGLQPNPIEYGAGKAAINQMTRYFAAMCGPRRIRVNSVAPGAFPWNATHTDDSDFLQRLAKKSMLGRIGNQSEITGSVIFLASDEASFVTGQVLSVDGGVTAW